MFCFFENKQLTRLFLLLFLFLPVAPVWQIEPQDIEAVKDKIAVVDCQAEGFPIPRIHWSKAEGKLSKFPIL